MDPPPKLTTPIETQPTHQPMADNKYTRYQFTAFEGQYDIIDNADKDFFKLIKWQDEIAPDTGRKHRQGCLATHRPVRPSAVRNKLPGVHIEPARNWAALLLYCAKEESRDVSGSSMTIEYKAPPKLGELLLRMGEMAWDNHLSREALIEMGNPPTRHHWSVLDKNEIKEEYWDIVNEIIYTEPNLIGILAQPLPQNAWLHTRQTWIKKAEEALERASPESNSITDEG